MFINSPIQKPKKEKKVDEIKKVFPLVITCIAYATMTTQIWFNACAQLFNKLYFQKFILKILTFKYSTIYNMKKLPLTTSFAQLKIKNNIFCYCSEYHMNAKLEVITMYKYTLRAYNKYLDCW